jgi:hypothetical protein
MVVDALLRKLEKELRANLEQTVTGFVVAPRTELEAALVDVAKDLSKERAKGLAHLCRGTRQEPCQVTHRC